MTDWRHLSRIFIGAKDGPPPATLETGTVMSVQGDGTCTVTWSGTTIPGCVPVGVTVVATDIVQMLVTSQRVTILGPAP